MFNCWLSTRQLPPIIIICIIIRFITVTIISDEYHSRIRCSSGRWVILEMLTPKSFSSPSWRSYTNPCTLKFFPSFHAFWITGIRATFNTWVMTFNSTILFTLSSSFSMAASF